MPVRKIELPDLRYDRKSHCYWLKAADGVWQKIPKETARELLGRAGSLAGYPVGVHEVKGLKILVPHSFRLIEPKEPEESNVCKNISGLIFGLFGEQATYLLAHLKNSYEALRDGRKTGSAACSFSSTRRTST